MFTIHNATHSGNITIGNHTFQAVQTFIYPVIKRPLSAVITILVRNLRNKF